MVALNSFSCLRPFEDPPTSLQLFWSVWVYEREIGKIILECGVCPSYLLLLRFVLSPYSGSRVYFEVSFHVIDNLPLENLWGMIVLNPPKTSNQIVSSLGFSRNWILKISGHWILTDVWITRVNILAFFLSLNYSHQLHLQCRRRVYKLQACNNILKIQIESKNYFSLRTVIFYKSKG